MKKKKSLVMVLIVAMMMFVLSGCETQADKVTYNLSQEADNFNVVRELTVINCINGDVIFQMSGRISIEADSADNQLEVLVEDENGEYQRHFIGLSDNVTYVVEDLGLGENDVNNYKYTLNYNPDMWLPEVDTID